MLEHFFFFRAEDGIRDADVTGVQTCDLPIFSIDGMRELHDRIRGVKGSYDRCIEALENLRRHGIPYGVNTQITAETMPQLRPLLHVIADLGVRNWQVQLTVAMGNAADHPEMILQP